jgi:autotransporter-associated beta strand protein
VKKNKNAVMSRPQGRAIRQALVGMMLTAAATQVPALHAQSTYTWTSSSPLWLNSTNWTGGPTDTTPGVDANPSSLIDGNSGDTATFGSLGFAGTTLGIDMSASANTGVGNNTGAAQLLSLGAIDWRSTSHALTIGKSDTATATSTLRLNGATVTPAVIPGSPVSNVLLSVSDAATQDLTIANTITGGTGTMDVQLGITGGSFYVKSGRTLAISSKVTELSAGSGFTKLGGGTLTLTGANTYTGAVSVQSGVLSVGSSGALGTAAGATSVASGAAVSLRNGALITGESIGISGTGGATGNGALQAATSATAYWTGTVSLDNSTARIGTGTGGSLTISGTIQNGIAGNTLNIGAGGTVILSGANTYTGGTNIIRGTLQLGADNALPTTTVLDVDSSNAADAAIFDLGGYDQTVAGLQRSVPAGGGGSVVKISGGGTSSLTVNQAIDTEFSGAITGGITLTKGGVGKLALTGGNNFTGGTTVTGGTLAVDPGALDLTGSVTVTSGGTLLLTGNGERINDSADLTLDGGKLSLQGLSNESENLGALILASDSSLDFGTGSGNTLTFTGLTLAGHTLSIYNWSGTHYFSVPSDPGTAAGQDRLLFSGDPGIAGISPQLLFYSDSGSTFIGDGKQVLFGSPASAYELVPIPEPGTWLAATALLGLVGWRERRRFIRRLV